MRLFKLLSTIVLIAFLMTCQQRSNLQPGEGFVEVKGGKVWYRIVGAGDKIPIVLLHGGPGYPSYYLNPLNPLSKDRPILMFDQLGCGRSERITDTTLMTIESNVEQTKELLKKLNIQEFYLYGHSWGTMLGMDFYLKHPQGIKALILAGPVLSTDRYLKDLNSVVSTLPDSIQKVISVTKATGDWQSANFQQAWKVFSDHFIVRNQEANANLDSANKQASQKIYYYMWGPSEFAPSGNLKNYERANDLKKINIPTLYIRGEFEATRNSVNYYQSLTLHSKLELVQNAGHMTMIDNPESEIKAISDFINELEKD